MKIATSKINASIIYLSSFFMLFSFFTLTNSLFTQELSFELNETGHALMPNLDVDSSGQFIAVWQDYRHCPEYGEDSEGGAAIYVQRFDTNGVKLGDNIRMDEKSDDDISNTNPDIAINKTNGDFVIVWQERSGSSENGDRKSRIIASIFKADFEKVAFQFVVDQNDTIWQAFPEVKYLSNNNILILWHENHDDDQFYYVKIFDPFGVAVSERFKVNSNNVSSSTAFFDALPSSGFYLVWDCYIQMYDNFGNPVTDILEGPFQNVNAVKSLNENDVLIVTRCEYLRRLEGIIYHVDQNSYGESFRIDDDTTTLNTRGSSGIAVNQSGDFIVVWKDSRNDYNNLYDVSDVYGQRFDNKAQPIGSNFKVNHEDTEREQHNPKVSFYHNRFIVIYSQGELSESTRELPSDVVDIGASRSYILGTSQDFSNPTPGQVYGWEYLVPPQQPIEFDASRLPYPNPFIKQIRDFVMIEFDLDTETNVSFEIYNILGQRIKKLSPRLLPEGFYVAKWYGDTHNGTMAASGIYLCTLFINGKAFNKKITFVKN